MFYRIFSLLLAGRKSYFSEEEAVQKAAASSRQKAIFFFLLYVFCRLFPLFLLTLPVPGQHHSGYVGVEKMPGWAVGQEFIIPPCSSPCPVGIKLLGADARRAR